MSRKVRGLVIAAGAVLFVVVILLGAWLWITRSSFPRTRGFIRVDGLRGPVEVLRDRWGVPHIYARSAEDLFFAEGFVHAQDRFWQMEFWRRISAGRLSEIFGKATLEIDTLMRTFGFRRLAEQEAGMLTPEDRRWLEAYAAGVNAYALHRKPARLGLEFALLGLQGVKLEIEPWTPADSIAWGKVMALDLAGNYVNERLNTDILRTVGSKIWTGFLPPYRPDMPYTLNEKEIQQMLGAGFGLTGRAAVLALGEASAAGSNNWVVSGTRSASGKPLLANDMHLGIQMPSIWYEIGLHGIRPDGTVGRTDACPFTVRGYSFPGTPGVITGYNDRIAWGVTNLTTDVQDVFIEKINPSNPDQYEVNGRWVDMEVRTETIKVRKADQPTVIRVRSTRHGPIISDRGGMAELAGFSLTPGKDFPEGVEFTAAALQWTALQPTRLVQAVLAVDQASSFRDFRSALRFWDIAAQNFVYADVDGNIGYQSTGLQPIRSRGTGLGPMPGWTDRYEWKGYVPFDKMPYLYNPEKGYVVTANGPIVPPSYAYSFGNDFSTGERARRIRDLIEADTDGLTVQDMERIQGDVFDLHASELVPYLRGIGLSAGTRPWDEPDDAKDLAAMQAARDRLLAWDSRMQAERPEPALYGFFWLALVDETFRDQFPENMWPPQSGGRIQQALYYLLKDPRNQWWDDVRTAGVQETRDDILARAFRMGYRAAVKKLGRQLDRWTWGAVHRVEFRNATLGDSGIGLIERMFNRGPVGVAGGDTTVFVTWWDTEKPFDVKYIPSQRLIVDLADPSASLSVHSTGQSGHPFNRHYDDFIEAWRTVKYHPTLGDRAQVMAQSRERLVLEPARAGE
jgi:penicillin amidase